MSQAFDAIVVGSGVGGAITACRAAEQGMYVVVLERGRRWSAQDYPRRPGDAWLFNDREPARQHGWLDPRFFPQMAVAQAAAVGGGSLTCSSVAIEAHPSLFEKDWPREITCAELGPYYDKVAQVMSLQTLPDGQMTKRVALAREGTERFDFMVQFQADPVAMPVEDRSVEWNVRVSLFIPAARIRVPPHTFDSPQQMEYAEHRPSPPWHSLPEHRPIGGVNRIRKTVHEQISTLRHHANGVPRWEPEEFEL